MSIHIGNIIQEEVKCKRLTQKEFGALIHKNEKTVPDIFQRSTMSIDLLVIISAALKKDFIKFFYDEAPMRSIRNDEVAKLNYQIQMLTEENLQLKRELLLWQDLSATQKDTLSFVKDLIEEYKLKLTGLAHCQKKY